MTDDNILKLMQTFAQNGASIGNIIMDNHGTMTINNNTGAKEEKPKEFELTKDILARAIEEVQQYFWGYSSNAVIFCVCRDRYHYGDNASQYERESRELEYHKEMKYLCTDGTIANAFNRNPYLKYNIDKWDSKGAKDRVLILRDEFIKAVEKAKAEMKPL